MDTPALHAACTTHILIAEDSSVQALMLRHVLEDQGHQVSVEHDGLSALKTALRIQPSLVISDVNMPGMSGYDLCRQIKATPALTNVPVILVTSLSEPDDVLLGLKSGADSFVIKPYDKKHLLARVTHALQPAPRKSAEETSAVNITFHGQQHQITASRAQILDLLMSTYEATVQRNKELHDSREQLRQRTSEAVAANRFLDSVIENIPDMIFIKEATDLKFVKLNLAGERLLGYPRAELLGKNDYDFFPKNEGDHFVAKDREVLNSGGYLEISEEPIHTANNGIRLLRTKKVAVLDEHGVPIHLLGISEDVTEQKELEKRVQSLNQDLQARAKELETANKRLENFTTAATHDLRAPLSIIGGYVNLLQKKYGAAMDEKGWRYLSVIAASVQNMARLIDDLLEFSKAGLREIRKAQVDMESLAETVMADLLQLHPEHRRPAIHRGPLPPAHADEALLRQVWVNLLSNAVKYSSRTPNPRIEVTGRKEGAEAIYSVRDNGAGFDMARYHELFEVFKRLHTDSEFEGTGVGLPIVQQIVTRHGGRVWAESKLGEGAVFHFTLPVEPDMPRVQVGAA